MADPLKDLVALTDALYQAEQARIRDITAEEARLRRALSELENHRRQGHRLPDEALSGLRETGADILWQGWIGRNKERLNIELAQVLARKAGLMRTLRLSFGRHQAARDLGDQAKVARQDRVTKTRLAATEALMLLQQMSPPRS